MFKKTALFLQDGIPNSTSQDLQKARSDGVTRQGKAMSRPDENIGIDIEVRALNQI